MSGFRIEDDENSNGQSSSGLGAAGVLIAAGAGIGALLYYFLNKGQGDYEAEQQFFRDRAGSIEICSICFEALMRREHVTSLRCGHNYHSNCVSPWIRYNQTCPMCRTVL